MEPQKKQFTPQGLRTLLTMLFIFILFTGSFGFYWGLGIVRSYAVEVNHRLADADASSNQILALQALAQNSTLTTKADLFFTTPSAYKTQVLSDINRYAEASGVAISNQTFADPPQTGIYSLTLTLEQPVSYTGLVALLHNIENNLPKLHINSLSLGSPPDGGANGVKTSDIKIDISVR